MHFLNILSFVIVLFSAVAATDYCKLCTRGVHTLCRYKEGPSDDCIEYRRPELTEKRKELIVNLHNDIRNHIASGQETRGPLGGQPAASNMIKLEWDGELSVIAQRWADQCISLNNDVQHDECRITDRFGVGQNVLTAITPTQEVPDIAILIFNWYKQVDNVLPSDVEYFNGIKRGKFLIGMYSQLVWADTRYVGCAMASFKNKNQSDPEAMYLHRLVCNYGPRGNVIGSSIYSRGVPCSKCPRGCDDVRPNLCKGFEDSLRFINFNFTTTTDKFLSDTKRAECNNLNVATTTEKLLSHSQTTQSSDDSFNFRAMLRNNLTKAKDINLKQKKVKIHLAGDTDLYLEPHEEALIISKKLDVLIKIAERIAKNKPLWKQNDIGGHLGTANKITDVLYRHGKIDFESNEDLFRLKEGRIVVDSCKVHVSRCQSNESSFSTRKHTTGEIVLPNDMVYVKVPGVWFHGRCRCNYAYRSDAPGLLYKRSIIYNIINHFVYLLSLLLINECFLNK